MQKLIAFPVRNHRLFNSFKHTAELKQLETHFKDSNPEFSKLLSLATNNQKLNLLLLIMLNKNSINLFFDQNYQKRLVSEFDVFLNHKDNYVLDYLLYFEDISHFYEQRNEISNIGRGSSPSSLVNYLLRITKVNPLEYGLIFERFLRKDSHIDIDFDLCNKDELISYLKNKYPYFSQVKISIKWRIKGALKEFLPKTLSWAKIQLFSDISDKVREGLGYSQLNDKPQTEKELFFYICDNNSIFNIFFKLNPLIKEQILSILDTEKEQGYHAGGFVIIDKVEPMMDEVTKDLIPRFDLLSLNAYKDINEKYTPDELDTIKITEEGVKEVVNPKKGEEGFLLGNSSFQLLPKTEPKTILDLAILIAKARPPIAVLIDAFLCKIQDTRITEVLNETQLELIFQEQALKILSNCLSVPLSESMGIFKEMSKQTSEYKSKRESYVTKTGENGEEIISFLEFASPYLFNKVHAISYALVDYYRFS